MRIGAGDQWSPLHEMGGVRDAALKPGRKTRPLHILEGLKHMKVLYAISEALPFIASGGLGDVGGSLPQALQKRRVGCRVVMPLYKDISPALRDTMKFITHITVPVAWRNQYCGIYQAKSGGVTYF